MASLYHGRVMMVLTAVMVRTVVESAAWLMVRPGRAGDGDDDDDTSG